MFIWRFNGAGMKEVSVDLTNIHEYSVEDLLDKYKNPLVTPKEEQKNEKIEENNKINRYKKLL
jgi:hypothetical protein